MMRPETIVFLDLEATGLNSTGNLSRITELSMVALSYDEFKSSTRNILRHLDHKMSMGSTENSFDTHVSPFISDPRVLNKLTLCFNPNALISHGVYAITGLDNSNLEHQSEFTHKTVNMLANFVERLAHPVAVIAHNGFNFDYPLLKSELRKACRTKSMPTLDTLSSNMRCDESTYREVLVEEDARIFQIFNDRNISWCDSLVFLRNIHGDVMNKSNIGNGKREGVVNASTIIHTPNKGQSSSSIMDEISATLLLTPPPSTVKRDEEEGIHAKRSKFSEDSSIDDTSIKTRDVRSVRQKIDFSGSKFNRRTSSSHIVASPSSNNASPSHSDVCKLNTQNNWSRKVENETTPHKQHSTTTRPLPKFSKCNGISSSTVKPPDAPRKAVKPSRVPELNNEEWTPTGTISRVRRRLDFKAQKKADASPTSIKSFKLSELHEELFPYMHFRMHSAEDDCMALLRVCGAHGDKLCDYLEGDAVRSFDSLHCMW